ncbi:MAG TPA: 5-methyltetrahydropteroyltriglutamate--homocysteine S-methyltransferase [Stellaceae bacterium]|jgi:5-methyltetrahydropteroyltriglutamate--homocysteine methyltransferase|nr:5-methyltetrahydropteroyltriglutamate--homocysteine S-methyltransferase [Stellaceae bacterium]
MTASVKPPYRADHVGSLLRPIPLRTAREQWLDGKFEAGALRALEDKSIRDAVALQESVGLASVTDGEFRRSSFHFDFLGQIEGVSATLPRRPEALTMAGAQAFQPPQLKIIGKIRHARNIEVEGFKFLKAATKRTAKLTIPSPTMLLRGGRGAVSETAYPDLDVYFNDIVAVYAAELKALGEAGCTYVQFDDTNFAYLCDHKMRQAMRDRGEDPEELPRRYVKLINAVIATKPAGMTICIHLCRGNMAGRWAAEGGYDPIAEPVFGQLAVDGYFLEYESARAGGFEPLRFMPKDKKVVLGLVSSKVPEMETKDVLKRRVDDAGKFMAVENMGLSPQCGFASSYQGNPVTEEIERRKLALVVETAAEIWNSAQ